MPRGAAKVLWSRAVLMFLFCIGMGFFGLSVAGAVGLLGDDSHQRVVDLLYAAVALWVVSLARRQLLHQRSRTDQ